METRFKCLKVPTLIKEIDLFWYVEVFKDYWNIVLFISLISVEVQDIIFYWKSIKKTYVHA